MQAIILLKFLAQWRGICPNRFVINMVKGHHLQLRCHPLLFHNFRWFNINASRVHHPIIQKEVHSLLAKGANEPSSGSAGFIIFVFPSTLAPYDPYSTLSD